MTSKRWAYEDLEIGQTFPLGPRTVSAEEIIAFAAQFDMQPMHLDEEAGKASILGGLSASGWHICAIFMRMLCDAMVLDSTSQGAPGVDYGRWKKPLLAGDTLSGTSVVTAKRLSASRPDLGFVTCRHEISNQRGELVAQFENTGMFLTRKAAA